MSAKKVNQLRHQRINEWRAQEIAENDPLYELNAHLALGCYNQGKITDNVFQNIINWQLNAAVRRARL